jgi:hypothetical protein
LQGFCTKHTRELFDIIQLLIRAKVKTLSDFLEIVDTINLQVIKRGFLEIKEKTKQEH